MIDDDPRIDPAELRKAKFPGSFRRYDAKAVEEFLEAMAQRVVVANELIDALRRELEDARAEGAPPPEQIASADLSTISEDELVRLVGEETAHVIATARKAAVDIRTKAEESAARVIREATAEASRMVEEAEAVTEELTSEAAGVRDIAVAEAEAAAAVIREDASSEAELVLSAAREEAAAIEEEALEVAAKARAEADRIIEEAREEGRSMVAEAKEVRTRILEDLQRRREIGRSQVERLIAGREQILAAYAAVRENVDEVTAQLEERLLESPSDPALEEGFVGVVTTTADDLPAQVEMEAVDAADDDSHVATAGPDPRSDDEAPEPAEEPEADSGSEAETEAATAELDPDDEPEAPAEDPEAEPTPVDEAEPTVQATAARDEGVEQAPGPEPEVEDAAATDARVAAGTDGDAADPAVEVAGEPEAGSVDAPSGDVDALFARIRSDRAESVARAQRVLAADEGSDRTDAAEPAGAIDDPEADAEVGDDAPVEAVAGEGVDQMDRALQADAKALAHRQEMVDPLDRALSRALKRHLADEQNVVLDALRRTESTDVGALLPTEDDHIAGYAEVAAKELAAAADAGAATIGGAPTIDVSALARSLGETIVAPFRRRIERSAAEVDGDADALDERLRALYREWKVEHIGAATADAVLSAYALGQHAAAPDGAPLHWRIDPAQGPCPDAQDNALAGAVPKGDVFPTGDACPQAHPGCRCLLVVEG